MGCSQSKTTTDEVVERVSEDTSAVANTDVSAPVVAIEDPPASMEDPPTVHASVAIDDDVEEEEPAAAPIEGEVKQVVKPAAEEEAEKVEESADAPAEEEVEKVAESAAAPVEGEVKKLAEFGAVLVEEVVEADAASLGKETPVLKIDVPVEEVAGTPALVEVFAKTSASVEDVAETSASVEEIAESSASVEEVATKLEQKSFEEEVEACTLQSAPLVEDNVLKPEAEVEASIEEEDEAKSEVVAVAPESEIKAAESSLIFKAENVTFNDKGVAFYNFDGSDLSNPVNDVHISKRYSDFKALHAQLTGKDGKVTDLPALPAASFLQGRNNRKMLEERKTQFTILLNAIATHPLALHSDVFKAFLA